MKTNTKHILIISSLVALTSIIWLGSRVLYGDSLPPIHRLIAKGSALSATVLMGFCLLLTTRLKLLENIFGGLDTIYQLHKKTGKYSFYLILLHPLFLSMMRLPAIVDMITFWGLQPTNSLYSIGHNIGVVSLVLLIVLIALSLWIRIPYDIWKLTHKQFGLVFVLVGMHIIFVDADVASYLPLSVWMYGWMAIGCISTVYSFFYAYFSPRTAYYIDHIDHHNPIIELILKPVSHKKLRFNPGQFVYLGFESIGVKYELHPYSIANAPNTEGELRFGIKQVGNHTNSLNSLKTGDKVSVFGPYGRFSEEFLSSQGVCIFVGGGIGITPFLGMWDMALSSEDCPLFFPESKTVSFDKSGDKECWKSPLVKLFYVVNNKDEASFDDTIQHSVIRSHFNGYDQIEERGHQYEMYESDTKGKITADYILKKIELKDTSDVDTRVFLCGPQPMNKALISQFIQLGISPHNIITEDFNLVHQYIKIPNFVKRRYTSIIAP